ncbi:hypothetical protein NEOLEDRAFT_1133097 [Neolentinus lepideus HHB14362 ss-1]|uniref:Uncharacterized protein n=1 Tax=Neolentinus lepideus HHB14362 ss-1 TaxID=1314782 RepID=A0A165ST45_9AGAM|nr:hypothetical protein NEOLEDRAFT_1133097 [Neolentinus lepideus HHB14362 ss-1]
MAFAQSLRLQGSSRRSKSDYHLGICTLSAGLSTVIHTNCSQPKFCLSVCTKSIDWAKTMGTLQYPDYIADTM